MKTDPPRSTSGPSRLAQRCLRALLPIADADAVIGDLNEERIGHVWSWTQELRAWQYVLALLPAAVHRAGRLLRYIVRDAVRSLRASPAASAGIILILALAISAATVTFSVVDTVVLRPLPFDDAHELVAIESMAGASTVTPSPTLGPQTYLALRDRATTLRSVAALVSGGQPSLLQGGETVPLESVRTTASLFDALRVRALVGSTFTAEHEVEGNHRVAVISYDLWQRRFGREPSIVGRSIRLATRGVGTAGPVIAEESFTVIGVMPQRFAYPLLRRPDIWTPYVMTPQERVGASDAAYLHVVARATAGAAAGRVQEDVTAVAASLREANPARSDARQIRVAPLKDTLIGDVQGWMLLVLGAVTVVMLVACVNVANLQLARSTRRARELSIRASLGATRRQLIASLLTESLLLSLAAAVVGIVVATWGIQAAKSALPADLLRVAEVGLDLRVLAAAISAAVVTGLLFGVVPAWQASREDLVSLLKQGGGIAGTARRRWRAGFAIAEVAFVSVLLVGATLIITSFIRVTTADIGFDRSNVLIVDGMAIGAEGVAEAIERIGRLPGVTAVGAVAASSAPLVAAGDLGGRALATRIRTPDAPADAEWLSSVELRYVSPGYFDAAKIPVIRGRPFAGDDAERQAAIVIDEHVAAALFGDRDAVGSEVTDGGGLVGPRRVAAVVRHVQLAGPEQVASPQIYLPMSAAGPLGSRSSLLVRTSHSAGTVIPAIRAAFPVVPGGSVQVRELADAFRNLTAERRFNAGLMSIFGVITIVIGAAGVYAVLASVVAQQTREMAVRVALGATTRRIVTSVVTQAGRYLIAGLAIGLAAAWWASQSIAAILYGVQPTDASVYATVAAVMIAVGVLAACIPAWRASRVDPLIALRTE